jgi:hypothetical protein
MGNQVFICVCICGGFSGIYLPHKWINDCIIYSLKSCTGDEVIYLDPHTTQPAGLVEEKEQEHEKAFDSSYHCQYASRMHILHMDPSVAAVRNIDIVI